MDTEKDQASSKSRSKAILEGSCGFPETGAPQKLMVKGESC